MKHRKWSFCAVLAAVGLLAGRFSVAEPADDFPSSIQALEWRNIGPFNGGRGTSVVGHPTDPQVFWFGHGSGGLRKTEDAGTYWMPVGDGQFRYASVGAIALHAKDPKIVYVGLGEPQMCQSVSWGDGMYKTVDGGETWTRIDGAFPQDEITRTIREDTERQGMLFVGTETGIYVSIDDGKEWRRLNLNMPPVAVHDIEVKGADLVVATHGRGFWILDDISPLRQYSPDLAGKTVHLFKPEDHTRFGYNWWIDYGGGPASEEKYFFVRNAEPGYTFYERGTVNGDRKRDYIDAGDARPLGVILYYLLSDQAKEVSLSILDEQGNAIRTFGSEEIPTQQFSEIKGRVLDGGLRQDRGSRAVRAQSQGGPGEGRDRHRGRRIG